MSVGAHGCGVDFIEILPRLSDSSHLLEMNLDVV